MMNDTKPKITELEELLWQLRDGSISAAGRQRIELLVVGDSDLRRFYIRHGMLCGGLRWMNAGGQGAGFRGRGLGVGGQGVDNGEWRMESGAEYTEIPKSPNPQISDLPVINLQISTSPLTTRHAPLATLRSWTFAYSVAALLLAVGLLGAWFTTVTHPDANALADRSRDLSTSTFAVQETPPDIFVGKVTGLVDCRWSDPKTSTVSGAGVILGRHYALKSGLMEITYDSGAKVILQGPCNYTVESARGGFLYVGKLVARVGARGGGRGARDTQVARGEWQVESEKQRPKTQDLRPGTSGEWRVASAANHKSEIINQKSPTPHAPHPTPLFTIRTPTAVITDLGTEFGVEVSDSGETVSHVFQGRVVVRTEGGREKGEGGEGENLKSEIRNQKSEIVLSAGQSCSVNRSNPVIEVGEAARPDGGAKRFVRVMPGAKPMRDAEAYAKYVLSLQPAAYYRMEAPKTQHEQQVVFDSSPGGHHGELRLAGRDAQPYHQGRFGGALQLRGPTVRHWDDARPPSVGDYALVADFPDARSGQFSVSAWVMAESRPQWAMIVCNSSAASEWYFDFGLHENDGDLSATSSRRYGKIINVREGASRPLPLQRWQHVAMTCDRAMLRLYRNGLEVASMPSDESVPIPEVQTLSIGSKAENHDDETIPFYCWQGSIDELAFFNRVLSAAEVRRLAGAAELTTSDNAGN